jgi:ribosomal protein L19
MKRVKEILIHYFSSFSTQSPLFEGICLAWVQRFYTDVIELRRQFTQTSTEVSFHLYVFVENLAGQMFL